MSSIWHKRCYTITKALSTIVRYLTIRIKIIHPEHMTALDSGSCLCAPTHISHLEPFFASLVIRRQINWMARIEFYKYRPIAYFLKMHRTFPVNRFGVPVSTIRRALHLLSIEECVGIFPEGGVSRGVDSVMRGADIKKGACLLSQRTGAPIIPVAMAGTHALNKPWRWLPFRWGYVVAAIGEPIYPPPSSGTTISSRRHDRAIQAKQLCAAYQALYQDILAQSKITEEHDK